MERKKKNNKDWLLDTLTALSQNLIPVLVSLQGQQLSGNIDRLIYGLSAQAPCFLFIYYTLFIRCYIRALFCTIDNEYRLLSLVGCRSGESARRFNLLSPFFTSVGEQLVVLDRRILGQQCQVLGDTEQWTKCTQDTAEHAGQHQSFDCLTPTCLVQ